MTDERPDSNPDLAPPGEPVESADAAPEAMGDLQADRRAFIRRLSGDAVWTAGRLAGLSSVIRRSVVAAGEAATRDLDAPLADGLPSDPAPDVAVPDVTSAPPAAPLAPDPVLALMPAQHDFLADGASAVLAVNDPAGAPHLTSSIYHWDGSTLRLPAQLFTARAEHVDRDPRVSVFIQEAASGAWVALSGVADVAYGDQAEEDMLLLLAKYLAEDTIVSTWEEMRSSGDRIVFRVRPTRFVWRTA